MIEDARAADNEAETAGLKEMLGVDPSKIKPDQYVLMRPEQDRQAAHRWNVLNEVRRKKASVTDKIIEYFRKNVGEQITGEELKYLAKDKKEWARRVCVGRRSTDLRARPGNPRPGTCCGSAARRIQVRRMRLESGDALAG